MTITKEAIDNRLAQLLRGDKKLLHSGNDNAKLAKNSVESYILNLSPFTQNSKGTNLCPGSTPGCQTGCLSTAGHGRMPSVVQTRLLNTEVFIHHRKFFLNRLLDELRALNIQAILENTQYAIRLNGTSDLEWVRLIQTMTGENILDFSNLIYYDYTKIENWVHKYFGTKYHLTFSRSETNWDQCKKLLDSGLNVAVVFHPYIPYQYGGYPVISGEENDMRFTDPKGVVVGLLAKGKAKQDKRGFVVEHKDWGSSIEGWKAGPEERIKRATQTLLP
ncbi:hypothetical protein GCM10028806_33690 [Spirosoma terrae]|uniref:Gene product 88 domain-containing protein n=1 Tax=Spirosoma terrae TaxID=1968276 RepID=A0A6L9L976_9BACT|nr:hypothetical protein [Spirosoma terrae]NDU95681.1 hypothetical protein [Spirosoma terrae]